jgi:hypothetical protein
MITLEERRLAFIEKANVRYGNKFDYSKFDYVNAKTKSIIICNVHGEYLQNPDKHLHAIHPCPSCLKLQKPIMRRGKALGNGALKRLPVEEYIARLNLPEKYILDTSGYLGVTEGTVKLTCPDHGSEISHPKDLLLRRYRCTKCSQAVRDKARTKSVDNFLELILPMFNEFITFTNIKNEYVNRTSILSLNCALHGDFQKRAQKLLSGQHCARCKIDSLIRNGQLTGGYDERLFASNPELAVAPATVYYLKVGSAYKIGITRNKLGGRISSIKNISKREVTVLQTFECTLEEAYKTEQRILTEFAEFRTFRRWSTEVFTKDVLDGLSIKSFLQ